MKCFSFYLPILTSLDVEEDGEAKGQTALQRNLQTIRSGASTATGKDGRCEDWGAGHTRARAAKNRDQKNSQ